MAQKNRTEGKSRKRIQEEILEDWADVRRWIDDLQNEWIERQSSTENRIDRKKSLQPRNRKSSGK